ncbi:MAG: KUP/HAK/KT family potassium transporter [Bacteroidota bacterium]|nr:KUP/HAK/KT family potassium transporter [Bacteroidota bacterium]
MKVQSTGSGISRLTITGIIITLGIVYGDIGTSPLYVVKAILAGFPVIKEDLIYGAISCIIWTLTLQTTIKYIIITLRADNKGEGGIFALFALIRRRRAWAYMFAVVGGSTLLADGIITPSITVTSAIEGLQMINPQIPVVSIVLVIITFLFVIQQFGTSFLGKSFGPIMFLWFFMLGGLGAIQIAHFPKIFHAFNPVYAYNLLVNHPGGFLILGAVFLATTGAEALYSDLGHCGIKNIRASWVYVKSCLILNYLGQGAWILTHPVEAKMDINPFYTIMPGWFLITGIILATAAAVIASQALISGSFTLISEAISLNFWPKLKISYPTDVKGQVYIPKINWFLLIACIFVVFYFRESSNMEAAYGLSITITMLMTTILLSIYLLHRVSVPLIVLFSSVFLFIETSFLFANLNKFEHGGWVTILMAGIFSVIMYTWYNGRKLKNSYMVFVKIIDYLDILKSLSIDESVPKYATNLVYITKANKRTEIESKIIFSLINKQPKRADVYWFLHVDIMDSPDTFEYEVTHFIPGKVMKVDFRLGFKVEPLINQYFRQIQEDLVENGEVDILSRYESLRNHHINGDFQFVLIDRVATYDHEFTLHQKIVMNLYNIFKRIGIPEEKSLNLDTSNVLVEKVPLLADQRAKNKIRRVLLS